MTIFVLDTDIVSLLQDGNAQVISHVLGVDSELLATSIITVEEQLSAWYTLLRKARQPEQLVPIYDRITASVRFFGRLNVLSFNDQAAIIFAMLRKKYPRLGRMDLRIAAIALAFDAILVTRIRSTSEI